MLGDFSNQASSYRLARPDYPEAMINQLIDDAGVTAGDAVADIGAGTGIFTRHLSDRELRVTAIEPNAAMREQAQALPGVRWISVSFENTSLEAASQRWVVAAQAFHWADPAHALPEMRRILGERSPFTVVWNDRDNRESDLLEWTMAAITRHVPEFDHGYRAGDWSQSLVSTGDFDRVDYRESGHVIAMNRQRYVNLWRSNNRLNTTAGSQRMAALLADLEDHLKGYDESIEVPYLCRAWTAW